jgi:hypothetical protein
MSRDNGCFLGSPSFYLMCVWYQLAKQQHHHHCGNDATLASRHYWHSFQKSQCRPNESDKDLFASSSPLFGGCQVVRTCIQQFRHLVYLISHRNYEPSVPVSIGPPAQGGWILYRLVGPTQIVTWVSLSLSWVSNSKWGLTQVLYEYT